jgi:serine/threonine protein kinase
MSKLVKTTDDGKYEIQSLCGSGGVGSVYMARQISLDRLVALKFLQQATALDDVMRQRFALEASILCRLNHRNIAAFYEWGCSGECSYFAMELAHGQPLSDLVHSADFGIKRAVAVVKKVAAALEYAHANGIIHRDLKPSNIMVNIVKGEEDEVKVIDFGFSKIVMGMRANDQQQQLTAPGQIVGSVPYMSPEQCRGEEVTESSDIYSLGCILYELLFGKPPFEGENDIAIMVRHLSHKPAFDIPDPLWTVADRKLHETVFRCLEKEAHARFQNAGELIKALDTVDISGLTERLWKQNSTIETQAIIHPIQKRNVRIMIGAVVTVAVVCFIPMSTQIKPGLEQPKSTARHRQWDIWTLIEQEKKLRHLLELHKLNEAEKLFYKTDEELNGPYSQKLRVMFHLSFSRELGETAYRAEQIRVLQDVINSMNRRHLPWQASNDLTAEALCQLACAYEAQENWGKTEEAVQSAMPLVEKASNGTRVALAVSLLKISPYVAQHDIEQARRLSKFAMSLADREPVDTVAKAEQYSGGWLAGNWDVAIPIFGKRIEQTLQVMDSLQDLHTVMPKDYDKCIMSRIVMVEMAEKYREHGYIENARLLAMKAARYEQTMPKNLLLPASKQKLLDKVLLETRLAKQVPGDAIDKN